MWKSYRSTRQTIYDKKSGVGTSTLSSPIKVFDALKTSKENDVEMPIYEIGSGICN